MGAPAVQDEVQAITPVSLAEKVEKADDLPGRLLFEETQPGLAPMNIQGSQQFGFATDALFRWDLLGSSTPGASSIGFEDQRAFFIKGEYPCLVGFLIQQTFNAFFSLRNEGPG